MTPPKQITVTSPLLPDLDEFNEFLRQIWGSKWITNNGSFHQKLESALCDYLKVPYISLFTNGTMPLITALQALRITGEVITTPYISSLLHMLFGGTGQSRYLWMLIPERVTSMRIK